MVGDGGVSTPDFSFLPRLTFRLCHLLGMVISLQMSHSNLSLVLLY